MAPWLIAALALLRSAAIGTGALVGAEALAGSLTGGGGFDIPFFGEEKKRRRRRRRALTASDRADIGFITGLLGPAAGKNFAITIATRTS